MLQKKIMQNLQKVHAKPTASDYKLVQNEDIHINM